MTRMNRMERPYLYGFSGSSKWLLDASMVIWNLVGIVALIGLIDWVSKRFSMPEAGIRLAKGGLTEGRGQTTPEALAKAEMAHARSLGDETSEQILERELVRSGVVSDQG